MIVVGLTGGIATGKSTVADILRQAGVPVIDADQVAREVVAPGEPALVEIAAAFGPSALTGAGTLDRQWMRGRITADADARATLEGITHPRIRQRIAERLASLASDAVPAAVVEAALMVETGSYRLYPALLVVSCPPETQLARLMSRDGMDRDSARALIATQLAMADKEAVATEVITNDADLQTLTERTLAAWRRVISTG